MLNITLKKTLQGEILDVGGGGEGVIGRIYQAQVTAVDNRQDELDEAPSGFRKLLMDARALAFPAASFDHVTAFYALMYMPKEAQAQAVAEAARVLKPGGTFHIWDANIASASPEPFLAELAVNANGEAIRVTYGIVREHARQDAAHFIALCASAGLCLSEREDAEEGFYLRFTKQEEDKELPR